MKLTDKQLGDLKNKIETEKVLPMKAINELYPKEDAKAIREQLFSKYDKKELRAFSKAE